MDKLANKRVGGEVRGESIFFRFGRDEDSVNPGLAGMQDDHRMPETTEEILKTCEHLQYAA